MFPGLFRRSRLIAYLRYRTGLRSPNSWRRFNPVPSRAITELSPGLSLSEAWRGGGPSTAASFVLSVGSWGRQRPRMA